MQVKKMLLPGGVYAVFPYLFEIRQAFPFLARSLSSSGGFLGYSCIEIMSNSVCIENRNKMLTDCNQGRNLHITPDFSL